MFYNLFAINKYILKIDIFIRCVALNEGKNVKFITIFLPFCYGWIAHWYYYDCRLESCSGYNAILKIHLWQNLFFSSQIALLCTLTEKIFILQNPQHSSSNKCAPVCVSSKWIRKGFKEKYALQLPVFSVDLQDLQNWRYNLISFTLSSFISIYLK